MTTRWGESAAPRGDAYDARWRALASAGQSVHGEADLVDALLRETGGRRVLDAGCGTGRVAIELATRGYEVVGVDLDPGMLDAARAKAPHLTWVEADLARLDDGAEPVPGGPEPGFDLVVMAGNVMIFLAPGTEAAVLRTLSARTVPGGLVVAGFQLLAGRLTLEQYDGLAHRCGLDLVERWATWDRAEFTDGDYAVSVHRRR